MASVQLVHHLLLCDEVRRLVHNLHQFVHVVWPFVQNVIRILISPEVHNSSETVNFSCDRLLHHKIRQKLLGFLQGEEIRWVDDVFQTKANKHAVLTTWFQRVISCQHSLLRTSRAIPPCASSGVACNISPWPGCSTEKTKQKLHLLFYAGDFRQFGRKPHDSKRTMPNTESQFSLETYVFDNPDFEIFPALVAIVGFWGEDSGWGTVSWSTSELCFVIRAELLPVHYLIRRELAQEFSVANKNSCHFVPENDTLAKALTKQKLIPRPCKTLSHSLVFRNVFQIFIFLHSVDQIRLFVVERCKNQVQQHALECLL